MILGWWLSESPAQNGFLTHSEWVTFSLPKPRLLISVFSLSQRVHAGEGDHSEYALAHPTAQCINRVGALHKVNIARRRASKQRKPIVSCPLFACLALLTDVRNSAQLTESRSPCICHRQRSSLFPQSPSLFLDTL